jgi:hypothetical protein
MKKLSLLLVFLINILLSCSKDDQIVADADKFVGKYSYTIMGSASYLNVTKLESKKINIEFTGSELGFLIADVQDKNLTIEPRSIYFQGATFTYTGTGKISDDKNTLTLSLNYLTIIATRY